MVSLVSSSNRIARLLMAAMLVAVLIALFGSDTLAASRDAIADRALGQSSFTTSTAGSGPSNLWSPRGIVVDSATGRIYVPDTQNNRVLGWSSATGFSMGDPATIIVTSDGAGMNLQQPSAVAVDRAGNLYVADSANDRILQYLAPITSSSVAVRVIGHTSLFGLPAADTLSTPYGVAVDSSGNLFVADTYNNRVVEFNAPLTSGMPASRVFGQPDSSSGANNQGKSTPGADTLYWPFGIAVDGAGNLYVSDTNNSRVLVYRSAILGGAVADLVIGEPSFTANAGGLSTTLLNHPTGLTIDTCGGLFVADGNNNRVLKYDAPLASSMAASLVFGQPNFTQNALSIPPTASSLNNPRGVAVDRSQNVYIADTTNNRVLGYDTPSLSTCSLYLPLVRK